MKFTLTILLGVLLLVFVFALGRMNMSMCSCSGPIKTLKEVAYGTLDIMKEMDKRIIVLENKK